MATGTAVDVVMPQMGVSVSEGTITKWNKQVGDTIEADETLLEISTDKVDTEVPSPASGVVTEIIVPEGETVEVGTVLARIGGEGSGSAPAAPAEPPEPATQPAADAAEAAATEGTAAPAEQQAAPAPAAPKEEQAAPAAAAPSAQAGEPAGNGKSFVSPVVARIASEHGIDPSQVPGTGSGGRVTKKDIQAYIDSGAQPQAQAAPAAPEAPAAAPAPAAPAAPAPPAPAQVAQAPADAGEPGLGESYEPMSAMRRGIADHMRRSLDTSAHVTSAIEVDMSKVVQIREKLKKEYQSAYGVNPTYLSFIARAATETLRDYPWVNGELRGDKIVTRNYVNLGFAVELADGKGLIVPVVKNAETLNLLGLAKAIADLAKRARDKQLTPDDVVGGTFTITNPGGYGTFHGTPVISQPQAGILGTYAIVKRPWVITDENGSRRDRDPLDHEPDADLRPPSRRRCVRRPLPARPARASAELGRGGLLEATCRRAPPGDGADDVQVVAVVVARREGLLDDRAHFGGESVRVAHPLLREPARREMHVDELVERRPPRRRLRDSLTTACEEAAALELGDDIEPLEVRVPAMPLVHLREERPQLVRHPVALHDRERRAVVEKLGETRQRALPVEPVDAVAADGERIRRRELGVLDPAVDPRDVRRAVGTRDGEHRLGGIDGIDV